MRATTAPDTVGVLGLGHAVPERVVAGGPGAGAPGGVRSAIEEKMFSAPAERRVLAAGETAEELTAQACKNAMSDAGVRPEEIDRLYGSVLVSRHLTPNGLYLVHQRLGLRPDAFVIPIATDFSNFLTGVILAREAVSARHAGRVLVACGASMASYVAPGSGYAVAIADGAGAAVLGPSTRLSLVDYATTTRSDLVDGLTIAQSHPTEGERATAAEVAWPTFRLGESLLALTRDAGEEMPLGLVQTLLSRNQVSARDVTLVTHQASRVLMEHWRRQIEPGEYIDTYDSHGNVTLASIPITLSVMQSRITTKYVIAFSPGPGMHCTAVLLRC